MQFDGFLLATDVEFHKEHKETQKKEENFYCVKNVIICYNKEQNSANIHRENNK